LVLVPEPSLLLRLLLLFAVLIPAVNLLVLKPLMQVLDQRSERIEGARARAERLVREAEDLASRHRDAIREAREAAEQQRRQLLDEVRTRIAGELGSARSTAEFEVERARADLGRALDEARGQLRGSAQELAGQIATRVLGRPIS
jgi:F-type H+-transporting ATPase subunit b